MIDDNNSGLAFEIDKDATNKAVTGSTGHALRITSTSEVTDGATYAKSGAVVSLTSNVIETSGTITDSAQVLDINQTHADATGTVLNIDNSGAGDALFVRQDGTLATNGRAVDIRINSDLSAANTNGMLIYSNFAHSVASNSDRSLVRFQNDNASAVNNVLNLTQDGSGSNVFLDTNGNGRSIDIDHDGNSASAIIGLNVNVANAGAGAAYAAIFEAGNVGVGTTAPAAALHLKAGTASANTAPQKFTSGTLLTTPEAGAVEFDGSFYYLTI